MQLRCVLLAGVLAVAGAFTSASASEEPAAFAGEIRVYGALRAMMHENQTASQVALGTLPQTPQLFGLGALEGLAGEVLILEGRTYVSRPNGADAAITEEMKSPTGAALLVTAQVQAWDGFFVDTDIAWEKFDDTLRQWVERTGWDLQQRLPFQILGTFPELHWHVIDGSRLQGGGGSHEEHEQSASRMQAQDVEARIVGFYSPSDQGVFTHHNSISHLHSLTAQPQQMGHVDQLVVPAGARVLLPSRQEANALEIVDAMLEFLGAAEQRQAVRSLTTDAECSGPGGEFKTTLRSIRPDRVYFDQVAERGRSRVWSLPQAHWGMNDAGEVNDVPSRVRPFVRGHEFHLLFLEMRQRFSGFRSVGQEDHHGEPCQRIAMQDEFGNPATVLIRDEDHQPLELVLNPPGAQGAVVVVPHVWKERDGVRWFRGFVLTEGVDRVFRYRYTRIEPNSVEAAFFTRPLPVPNDEENE